MSPIEAIPLMKSRDHKPVLSVVIPCYNEELRMFHLRKGVWKFVRECQTFDYEFVFVDDGSTDDTAKYLDQLAFNLNRTDIPLLKGAFTVKASQNGGKGAALRNGVLSARGDYILTVDCDMATPITQILEWEKQGVFRPYEETSAQVLFLGNRRNDDTKNSLLRSVMSTTFNLCCRFVAGLPLNDTQCGFKIYPRRVGRNLFKGLKELGWAHDIELLCKARLSGMTLKPLAVNWQAIEGSKVNVIKDSIKMFVSIFKIRLSVINVRGVS